MTLSSRSSGRNRAICSAATCSTAPGARRTPQTQPPHIRSPNRKRGGSIPALSCAIRTGARGSPQPPVFFLPSFTMTDASGTRRHPGGRFRLETESLQKISEWSWSANPFVRARPYNGLLVILLMFNSWDLKDSNNTLYEVRNAGSVHRWYVVRDLGAA